MSAYTTKDIVYRSRNERDVEQLALLSEVKAGLPRIHSLLDVGACYSHQTYAAPLADLLSDRVYDAVDLEHCPQTEAIVDNYFVGNINEVNAGVHDFVSCVSVIEHVGIKATPTPVWPRLRGRTFSRLLALANSDLFVTCPFGAPAIYEGEYANVTDNDLVGWRLAAGVLGFKDITTRFFFNEFAQGGNPWTEITEIEASDVPLNEKLGVQCVLIFHARK